MLRKATEKCLCTNTADSEAKLETELADDTDAEASAVPWEQRKIGELLSDAEGGPSPLFRGMQLVVALVPILIPVRVDGWAAEANMERPNELLWLNMFVFACAFWLLLPALGSARVALRPGGPLEQLGAGEQKISVSDANRLKLLRVGLWALSALSAAYGLSFVVQALTGRRRRRLVNLMGESEGLRGWFQTGPGSVIPAGERVYMVLMGVEFMTVVPIIFVGWWGSMGTACCLCRDKAIEIIRKVHEGFVIGVPSPAVQGKGAPRASTLSRARAAFERFDVDSSGTLSKGQCTELIAADFSVTRQYLGGVWSVYDRNADGALDFKEFSTMYSMIANRFEVKRAHSPTSEATRTSMTRLANPLDSATDDNQLESWDENVVMPTLELCRSMDTLSGAWGSGLVGTSGSLLLVALWEFVNAVNLEWVSGVDAAQGLSPGTLSKRHQSLGWSIFWTVLALLLALDLASTTSRCDLLRAQLNHADIKHAQANNAGIIDDDTSKKIDWLLCRLQRVVSTHQSACNTAAQQRKPLLCAQNNNQGLGFTLGSNQFSGGWIINRKFLTLAGFRLASSFTALYTILMAMSGDSTSSAGGEGACDLTEAQVASIRVAMSGRNASCSYDNVTIGSALIDD